MMLTKQQFYDKHKEKLSKLTPSEKAKRYRDYQLSQAMRKDGTRPTIPRPAKAAPGQVSYATMSECSKLYVRALLDPWDLPSPPCVPDNLTLPSYKFAARLRTNFVIGLQGVGFTIIDPYVFCTNQPCAGNTAASYNQPDMRVADPNVPYSSSDSVLDLVSFKPSSTTHHISRIVGFGVRARYVGSEISRSGQCVSFREAGNNGEPYSAAPITVATILASREAVTVPSDRKWHAAVWRPATPRDISYFDDYDAFQIVSPSIGILVTGGVPGTSFEVDVVGWYEVIGTSLPSLTRSHSDPNGMAVVSAAMATTQPTATPSDTVSSFIRNATSIANESLSFIGAVKPVVKAGLEIASLF